MLWPICKCLLRIAREKKTYQRLQFISLWFSLHRSFTIDTKRRWFVSSARVPLNILEQWTRYRAGWVQEQFHRKTNIKMFLCRGLRLALLGSRMERRLCSRRSAINSLYSLSETSINQLHTDCVGVARFSARHYLLLIIMRRNNDTAALHTLFLGSFPPRSTVFRCSGYKQPDR